MCQPPSIESAIAEVRECADVGAGHSVLRLAAGPIARSVRPGNFAMVGFPGRTDPFLSRPLAVFDAEADTGTVSVLVKAVGRGTEELARASAGDRLRLVAPLGNAWRIHEGRAALLVAGGTGYAALHLLAKALVGRGSEVQMIWGQACSESFPDIGALEVPGAALALATDDGTCGFCGTSVECLADMVASRLDARAAAVYGAGPLAMLGTLAEFARERDLPCQVSLEARMACGIGVCRACVVNATSAHPDTGLRRRAVCADGPVFDARELDWRNPW